MYGTWADLERSWQVLGTGKASNQLSKYGYLVWAHTFSFLAQVAYDV